LQKLTGIVRNRSGTVQKHFRNIKKLADQDRASTSTISSFSWLAVPAQVCSAPPAKYRRLAAPAGGEPPVGGAAACAATAAVAGETVELLGCSRRNP